MTVHEWLTSKERGLKTDFAYMDVLLIKERDFDLWSDRRYWLTDIEDLNTLLARE